MPAVTCSESFRRRRGTSIKKFVHTPASLSDANQTRSASSQQERRTNVKKRTTKKRSRTNWARLDALKDKDIDTSDIPEQEKAFFKHAVLRLPKSKTAVTIYLDRQVLEWFKAKGPGYQKRINALLRAYMERTKDEATYLSVPSLFAENTYGNMLSPHARNTLRHFLRGGEWIG